MQNLYNKYHKFCTSALSWKVHIKMLLKPWLQSGTGGKGELKRAGQMRHREGVAERMGGIGVSGAE